MGNFRVIIIKTKNKSKLLIYDLCINKMKKVLYKYFGNLLTSRPAPKSSLGTTVYNTFTLKLYTRMYMVHLIIHTSHYIHILIVLFKYTNMTKKHFIKHLLKLYRTSYSCNILTSALNPSPPQHICK